MSASDRVAQDRERLLAAQHGGLGTKIATFTRLSGPGWLQSALTLGGGSLASSLYLGVLAGVGLLWLQPVAMVLGIVMLSAISYVTLSTGERPFRAINTHVSPVLGWAWLLASLAANMVWALPQYSLCFGVLEQNLLPDLLGPQGALAGDWGKWTVSGVVLALTTAVTWSYGGGGAGIKIYETVLKLVVALIVLCFFGVVIKLASTDAGIDWSAVARGFVPDLSTWSTPAAGFASLLDAILDPAARQHWVGVIVAQQRDVMISAAATAVGINMTFLLPYSMLAKGWTREFRGLAIFDLSTGMLLPFVLATSCVIVASASQFHAQQPAGFHEADGAIVAPEKFAGPYGALLSTRAEAVAAPLARAEQQLAATLVKRDAMELADALEPLTGATVSNWVFGIGVVAMTLSTISLLMLISGFVLCEILNVPPTGWVHRLGCLAAASGVLWPLLWAGKAKFWLAIVTSVFGMTLLPIAYLAFFALINQRSLLGDQLPRGARRWVGNLVMAVSAGAATAASLYVIQSKAGAWGLGAVGVLVVAAIATRPRRRAGA